MKVFEASSKVVRSLKKYQILAAYKKAKQNIEEGNIELVQLKKRKPSKDGIYQFRITKKYRAFGQIRDGNLVVFHISDHQ